MPTLNSYKEVQDFITGVLTQNGDLGLVDNAPHTLFWQDLSYSDFVNGDVPGVTPATKILAIGQSGQSNLIAVLRGTNPNFAQMPDGGTAFTDDQIAAIADWIDKGCPQFAAGATPAS